MKPAEIRAMPNAQLDDTLRDLHGEWSSLRFQDAVGALTHTSRIRQIRKDIARIITIQSEREFEASIRGITLVDN